MWYEFHFVQMTSEFGIHDRAGIIVVVPHLLYVRTMCFDCLVYFHLPRCVRFWDFLCGCQVGPLCSCFRLRNSYCLPSTPDSPPRLGIDEVTNHVVRRPKASLGAVACLGRVWEITP